MKEYLIAKGFELKTYPDGMFWILMIHDELFYQANEALDDFSSYDDGFVDIYTEEEFIKLIDRLK